MKATEKGRFFEVFLHRRRWKAPFYGVSGRVSQPFRSANRLRAAGCREPAFAECGNALRGPFQGHPERSAPRHEVSPRARPRWFRRTPRPRRYVFDSKQEWPFLFWPPRRPNGAIRRPERAPCKPGPLSPIPISSSIAGVSAAAESSTSRSIAPDAASRRAISRHSSALSGRATGSAFETNAQPRGVGGIEDVFRIDPRRAQSRFRCVCATMDRASVVLPQEGPPAISVMRPRGNPPSRAGRARRNR